MLRPVIRLVSQLHLFILLTTTTITLKLLLMAEFRTAVTAATAVANKKRIAIIGAGASGIIATDVFLKKGFAVTTYEANQFVGGVWKYVPGSVMYDSLRTNLPKEIMAFNHHSPIELSHCHSSTFSTGSTADSELLSIPTTTPHSYLTHGEVQQYLEEYVQKHDLMRSIRLGERVTSVQRYIDSSDSSTSRRSSRGDISRGSSSSSSSGSSNDTKTRWVVHSTRVHSNSEPGTITSGSNNNRGNNNRNNNNDSNNNNDDNNNNSNGSCRSSSSSSSEEYDFVLVCNGHYSAPFQPPLAGSVHLQAAGVASHHSSDYDLLKKAGEFNGKRVVVVGSKSSGTDMARELTEIAAAVMVSDRNFAVSLTTTTTTTTATTTVGCSDRISSSSVDRIGSSSGDSSSSGDGNSNSDGGSSSSNSRLTHHPGIDHFDSNGCVVFKDGHRAAVDVLLWCTGFNYDFPFLHLDNSVAISSSSSSDNSGSSSDSGSGSGSSSMISKSGSSTSSGSSSDSSGIGDNVAAASIPVRVEEGKRVRPLYLQLFALRDPTLAFVGLPFSVVPFPLFFFQSQLLAAVYSGEITLPSEEERRHWLHCDELDLQQRGLMQEKYHFLGGGSAQWDYCRMLAALANTLDPWTLRYIDMLQSIYEDNGQNKPPFTGARDSYRDRLYSVDRASWTWTVSKL